MKLHVPEFDNLPPEQRNAILRSCMQREEYRTLRRRQGPRGAWWGAALTILGVLALIVTRDISLTGAVIVTWVCFLITVPLAMMLNAREQHRLLRRLVQEQLDRGAAPKSPGAAEASG